MAYARVFSVGLVGLNGEMVEVEANLAAGLPAFVISGLPDTALSEARDRVRAAITNTGADWPNRKITVNLRPASMPKRGSGFDLAIACALLLASGAMPGQALADVAILGELGLDGHVRPLLGVLPAVLAASQAGFAKVVVPPANVREAQLVPQIQVYTVESLRALLDSLAEDGVLPEALADSKSRARRSAVLDLVDVAGQEQGRRALEVAAAGGHNLALFGPPGAGKTMLAERLTSLLPSLDDDAALEVTAIHSIAGALPADAALLRDPPYQAPHHTATTVALVGGGSGMPRPGLLSLAHRGVLFLDEANEFPRAVLDALREPLEHGSITVSRAAGLARFPARVQVVLAANPCPCANPSGVGCECTPGQKRRYRGRISGPLLDRIDLRVWLHPVGSAALLADHAGSEGSTIVAKRVAIAREAATARWARIGGWSRNVDVPTSMLRQPPWRLPRSLVFPAARAVDLGELSARGFGRVLRIAWTLADLGGRERPDLGDVGEALELRLARREAL